MGNPLRETPVRALEWRIVTRRQQLSLLTNSNHLCWLLLLSMVSVVGAFIFTNTQIQGLCKFFDSDVMHQTVAHVSLKFKNKVKGPVSAKKALQ